MATQPLRTRDQFIVACARLKRSSPNSWSDFEKLFEALWADAVMNCVQSPGNEIFSKQGRAQLFTELRDTFKDCVAEADKLEAKMKGTR